MAVVQVSIPSLRLSPCQYLSTGAPHTHSSSTDDIWTLENYVITNQQALKSTTVWWNRHSSVSQLAQPVTARPSISWGLQVRIWAAPTNFTEILHQVFSVTQINSGAPSNRLQSGPQKYFQVCRQRLDFLYLYRLIPPIKMKPCVGFAISILDNSHSISFLVYIPTYTFSKNGFFPLAKHNLPTDTFHCVTYLFFTVLYLIHS
jgi:hypothetical protein